MELELKIEDPEGHRYVLTDRRRPSELSLWAPFEREQVSSVKAYRIVRFYCRTEGRGPSIYRQLKRCGYKFRPDLVDFFEEVERGARLRLWRSQRPPFRPVYGRKHTPWEFDPKDEIWIPASIKWVVVTPRGEGFADLPMTVELTDGTTQTIRTDGQARWGIENIDRGLCHVWMGKAPVEAGPVVYGRTGESKLLVPESRSPLRLRASGEYVLIIPDPDPFLGVRLVNAKTLDPLEGRLSIVRDFDEVLYTCGESGLVFDPLKGRTKPLDVLEWRKLPSEDGDEGASKREPPEPYPENESTDNDLGHAFDRDQEDVIETRVTPDGKIAVPKLVLGGYHALHVHVPEGPLPIFAQPLGGMSISPLGEKFAAHAFTGAGGATVGLSLPAARALTPGWGLAYHTDACNGPYGYGWADSIPFIARSTTRGHERDHGRGLPEYDDDAETDVFTVSDGEDLVKVGDCAFGGVAYRPRIERGPQARVQRLVAEDGAPYWKVTSPSNVVSIFGRHSDARVADPADPLKVFKWLLQEQIDAFGNVIVYQYKAEDLEGIDPEHPAEVGREPEQEPQRYLKRILYNNRIPEAEIDRSSPEAIDPEAFTFEVVFDYGEHASDIAATPDEVEPWLARPDAFSYGRAGFEIRTRRLCRRVLLFHRFATDPSRSSFPPELVRSLELTYDETPTVSLLVNSTERGHKLRPEFGEASTMALPTQVFEYTRPKVTTDARVIEASELEDLDLATSETIASEVFDFEGTGVAGIMVRDQGVFTYRPGLGNGTFGPPQKVEFAAAPQAEPTEVVQQFLPVTGQGRPGLIEFRPGGATLYDRDAKTSAWASPVELSEAGAPPDVVIEDDDPRRTFVIDLEGSGRPDALIAEGPAFKVWTSKGAQGWKAVEEDPEAPFLHTSEDEGPGFALGDPEAVTFFADTTGDGLPDVVWVRDGEMVVWPSLGRGRFGHKMVWPVSVPGPIEQNRFRWVDLQGLGPWGLVYFGPGGATVYANDCGRGLASVATVAMPDMTELDLVSVVHVDGRGTPSIVWGQGTDGLHIVDLGDVLRPCLLIRGENGQGLTTRIDYAPSTTFYLDDLAQEQPWLSRLPFAVPVASSVEVTDAITGRRATTHYTYHHGHYDAIEREFRGFGRVEQVDSETLDDYVAKTQGGIFQVVDAEHYSPPKRTKTWFHTGFEDPNGSVLRAFVSEYSTYDAKQAPLQDLVLPSGVSSDDDKKEALRALKGQVLRIEVFAEDDSELAERPLTITEHTYAMRVAVAKGGEHHGVFQVWGDNSLTLTYEREDVPDPRAAQTFVTKVDDDHVIPLQTVALAYPRRLPDPTPLPPPLPDDDLPPSPPPEPEPECFQLTGMLFDEAKSFVRPENLQGLTTLVSLLHRSSQAELAWVGHTDTEGSINDNDALSLDRASMLIAYLHNDVDAWLLRFTRDVTSRGRWGNREEALMLEAVGYAHDVVGFQASRDLVTDGILGPNTRRALITAYMNEGPFLPDGMSMRAFGGGEHYLRIDTDDDTEEALNRRAEVFVFPKGINPQPEGAMLGPHAESYLAWRGAASELIEVQATTGVTNSPLFGGMAFPSSGFTNAPMMDSPAFPSSGGTILLTPSPSAPAVPVTLPLRSGDPQLQGHVTVTDLTVTHQDKDDAHRLGIAIEVVTKVGYAKGLHSMAPLTSAPLAKSQAASATALSSHIQHLYYTTNGSKDDKPASLGDPGLHALPYATRTQAFEAGSLEAAWAGIDIDLSAEMARGGYQKHEGAWWTVSGRNLYDAERFFLPVGTIDAWGAQTSQSAYDDDAFFVLTSSDTLANGRQSEYDTHALAPRRSLDANGVVVEHRYNALGLLSRSAAQSPDGPGLGQGDTCQRLQKPHGDTVETPTTVITYDLLAFQNGGGPCSVTTQTFRSYCASTTTETRHDDEAEITVTYQNGAGAEIQTLHRERGGVWRSAGRTVTDNRGKAVFSYEAFEAGSQAFAPSGGELAATHLYDALGRPTKTVYRDGSLDKVELTAWQTQAFDRNDTIDESDWAKVTKPDLKRLDAVEAHAETPTLTKMDSLGRAFATVAMHTSDGGFTITPHVTQQVFDVRGNAVQVIDARGNLAETREFGLLGQVIKQTSTDAGTTLDLTDIDGQPLCSVDALGRIHRTTYDVLHRPIDDIVQTPRGDRAVRRRHVYLDALELPDPRFSTLTYDPNRPGLVSRDEGHDLGDLSKRTVFHRSRLYRIYDGAGSLTIEKYDFNGNPTKLVRRPLKNVGTPDWSILGEGNVASMQAHAEDLLSDDRYIALAEYDSQSRPIRTRSPTGMWQRFTYNGSGATETVEWQKVDPHHGAIAQIVAIVQRTLGYQVDETFHEPTDDYALAYHVQRYDRFGRPLKVIRGDNVATTQYGYDDLTHRLTSITTQSAGAGLVQGLQLTHDPVGNILQIVDQAQKAVHFDNAQVEAANSYRYDSLYRLIEATGREHVGQNARGPKNLQGPIRSISPKDPTAMRRYTQTYHYDAVGNIRRMRHSTGAKTASASWTRDYKYASDGNRLLSTSTAKDLELYAHDPMGNMVTTPHLDVLEWGDDGQLVRTERGTQTVHFQYSADGSRFRKLARNGNNIIEERLYLGASEKYQKRKKNGEVLEETVTEHIAGGLVIEFKTKKKGKTVNQRLVRHQLSNHQGSVGVELNEHGNVISIEDYHPFGTSAYRATDAVLDISANRYRYTGMERDDETGMALHGARYYMPWLGRWSAADPIGLGDGVNRYRYCANDPVGYVDRGGTKANDEGRRTIVVHTNEDDQLYARREDLDRRRQELAELSSMVNQFAVTYGWNSDEHVAVSEAYVFAYNSLLEDEQGYAADYRRRREEAAAAQRILGSKKAIAGIAVIGVGGGISGGIVAGAGFGFVGVTLVSGGEGGFTSGALTYIEGGAKDDIVRSTVAGAKYGVLFGAGTYIIGAGIRFALATETPSYQLSSPHVDGSAGSEFLDEGVHFRPSQNYFGPDVCQVANTSKTTAEMANDVAATAGKHRVSVRTAGGKIDMDLKGKGHFDKASGQKIETPHVHESTLSIGPNGQGRLAGKTTRAATKQDVRTARKILERRK